MRTLLLLGLLFFTVFTFAQEKYKIMFYNVENYFDVEDDPNTIDEEFLPKGIKNWNKYRMYEKNDKVGKVIMAAGGWDIPVLVGVSEVESDAVGQLLTKASPIKDLNYGYLHQESQDRRGIDVMLLYRKDYYTPIKTNFYPVEYPADPYFKSRDILYSKGVLGGDTLHIFVNHWPSKYGGTMATIPLRKAAALTLKKRTDSIMAVNPMAKIIIMGDLNDEANEPSLVEGLGAIRYQENLPNNALVNLSWPTVDSGKGSSKYQGNWSVIDHIIVSKGMLEGQGLKTTKDGMAVKHLAFLLEKDDRYLGQQPNRTYRGYTYHGGYSDHLPVILEVTK
ncbi:MAG: endonuclease [Bacteroidales bacterium]|jgi:endonuclease/exonuclease/phosphatase family metal-dependent hydrolase|nr:endonuclease [Bacteroidales bacterium]